MKTSFLRALALALCAVMIFALAACASPSPATPGGNNTQAPPSSGEPVTLTFWHIWGSGDPTSEAVKKVVDDFNALDNNITIRVETFENDPYKDKIRVDIPGGTGPDIFSSWGGGESKPYVDNGNVLALDSYLDSATMNRMLGGALANTTYDGKVYGLTFGLAASGFYCNNRLFAENDIKIPATWEELLSAIEGFQAVGITPISTTVKERWVIGMLFDALVLRSVGIDGVMTALTEGGEAFAHPGFKLAAEKLAELVSLGAFNADANAISRDDAEIPVQLGEVPMYYMGSWAAGMLASDETVDQGDFTYIPFPTIPGGSGAATEFMGGAVDCVMVNSNTENPDAAAEFVKYFAENVAREGYLVGSYMPVWQVGSIDESEINPIMVSIKQATASATGFVMWFDTFLGPDLAAIYQDAMEELLAGQITPDDFVEAVKLIEP
ncbi:MAG: extracellular solute-binding protein [Oscillospiraceae bacterium]|nr:extracellular solute-binding protein [Oscillospiraceae bacterium]